MHIESITGETSDADLAGGTSVYSVEQAKRIVEAFARTTSEQDVEAFVQGFTEDCVVQFPTAPTVVGHDALRRLMAGFFSKEGRLDFVCHKRLRAISGNVLGVVWFNDWIDARTRQHRQSKGVEFWVMRGERIARWDACTASWDADD